MTSQERGSSVRGRVLDYFLLISCGVLVCIVTGGAFLLADIYHVNPLWVIVSLISVGFLAGAREDYRKELRSTRFVAFVCGWVVINAALFVIVLGLFGWLWLILALALEQILFYMTAYWLFGLPPPLGRRGHS